MYIDINFIRKTFIPTPAGYRTHGLRGFLACTLGMAAGQSWPPALLVLLVLLVTDRAFAALEKALVEEVTPIGGPVQGDTAITVRGRGLSGVECIFTRPGPNPPPQTVSPCKFEPTSPDAGRLCVCSTPRAPQHVELIDTLNPDTGLIVPTWTAISDLLTGPVIVTAAGTEGTEWSPFDVFFTYYELNRVVNVTSIEPSGGHPDLETLVTVHGNGFFDYGGRDRTYCSYPGPRWDNTMHFTEPDYLYQDFTSPATIVDTHTILCTIPPLVNNSDPVFVEVCLSGHPDRASEFGRLRHDDFCTSSLTRFDYVDTPRTNLTLWNSSVIAVRAPGKPTPYAPRPPLPYAHARLGLYPSSP